MAVPLERQQSEIQSQKCFLLTFIKFTEKKTSLSLLSDCVEEEKVDKAVVKYESNGFREITGSRSKERFVREGETLTITYGGELQAGKAIQQSTIKIKQGFVTSPVTTVVKINRNANYCIIHYLGNKGCGTHQVLFAVKEEYKQMSRPRMWSVDSNTTDQDDDNTQGIDKTGSVTIRTYKITEVDFEERDTFLQGFQLKRFQFLISNVYRSEEEAETEVAISADLLQKMQSVETIYSFSFYILRDQKMVVISASFDAASRTVNGPVLPKDVFCAVAEFTAERKTLGKNGGSFISEKDNRIQVQVPAGALDRVTDFTFRIESVDLDRYRQYGEKLPDIFKTLVGFPTSLSIEHGMKKPLKEKAKIYLPVIRDGNDEEVLFVYWEDEKAIQLCHKEDQNSPDSPYYVEVDSLSTISAQTKRSQTTMEETIRATRLLMGQTSVCIVLTYVVRNHMRGMPGLLIDCVELHRVKDVMKELKEEGYVDVPGSRSNDCHIDEGGYVNVEIGGNLQLEPGIRKKDIRVRFFRNRSTNRILVPVKFKNPNQPLSTIVYTANRKDWVFRVHFSMSDFVEDRQERSATRLSLQEQASEAEPHVLSEKSLSALGRALPDSTWHEVGIELDMSHDKVTAILEAKKDTSGFGFRLLKQWIQNNARKTHDELIDKLTAALTEIERGDVAEIVRKCRDNGRPIRRKDFGGGAGGESQDISKSPSTSKLPPQMKPFR